MIVEQRNPVRHLRGSEGPVLEHSVKQQVYNLDPRFRGDDDDAHEKSGFKLRLVGGVRPRWGWGC